MNDKVNDLMQIGGRLSVCRQNKNMTQEELAYRLGITPQALSKWERGVSFPDISMLADISRLLDVSTDYLLGIGMQDGKGDSERALQLEIGNNLNICMEPLELIFGVKVVSVFLDNKFVPKILEMRRQLSRSGILLPIVRIRDDMMLSEQEFMILAHHNVLYCETLETIDEGTVDYMFQKLEKMVREKYYEILDPDIVKNLVDNLKIRHPALIEGVVPERIPYSLLTEVMKKVLARGDSAAFLPKIIEIMDCALYHSPGLLADELADRVAHEIEREDNFYVMIHKRRDSTVDKGDEKVKKL